MKKKITLEQKKELKNILFLDIETVSLTEHFEELNPRLQQEWKRKATYFFVKEESKTEAELYFDRAAIYAEFGKIISIALGFFYFSEEEELLLKTKCLANLDEKILLEEFSELLSKFSKDTFLCAHNGKEFDFPYLCRRFIINSIALPSILQISTLKPWEVKHLDTFELWKFGDKKSFTSLELLATVLGVKSSKIQISGDQVNHFFYREKDGYQTIQNYCVEDVEVLANVYLRLKNLPILE